MHKITPLDALILAVAAKRDQSSPQFVIKTQVCVAISTGTRNGAQEDHIGTENERSRIKTRQSA
jgi:hypothetical protein